MLRVETKEIKISEELKRKIEMIGKFTNTKPVIHDENILNIKGTNIAYVKPHVIVIKTLIFMVLDECDDVFVNNLQTKIKFKDLEDYIKTHI